MNQLSLGSFFPLLHLFVESYNQKGTTIINKINSTSSFFCCSYKQLKDHDH